MMERHVLVVDDDVDIRETLVDVLEQCGLSALEASNGREALDRLLRGEDRPCLIFLDLMMPVMDGRAFREAQLEHPMLRDIPVVILSAFRDVDSLAENLGVARVLKKPVKLSDIRASVDELCPPARA